MKCGLFIPLSNGKEMIKIDREMRVIVENMMAPFFPGQGVNTVYQALIISCVLYALPVWGVFLNAGQSGSRIDATLKRAYKCGFSNKLITVTELSTQSCTTLFDKIQNPFYCLNRLQPPK